MNKVAIVAGLRGLAKELQPFTQEMRPGGRVWNGTAYVQSEASQADPYALMWWSTLTAIADLLEAQDAPLSASQIEHLRSRLFGGMGSFSDYSLDVNRGGDPAKAADERLQLRKTALFRLFE